MLAGVRSLMPFGGTGVGIAAFSAIKLAGYSGAAVYINRRERLHAPRPLVVGAARAAIGMAVGIAYAFTLSRVTVTSAEWTFYAGLIPVRLFEWLAVLWLFYRTWPGYQQQRWGYAAKGIAWSFCLDVPAVLAAFVVPGGFWIC
jgi:hypothetical protein